MLTHTHTRPSTPRSVNHTTPTTPHAYVVGLIHARRAGGHIGRKPELEETIIPEDRKIRVRSRATRDRRAQHVVHGGEAAAAPAGREGPRAILCWPAAAVVVGCVCVCVCCGKGGAGIEGRRGLVWCGVWFDPSDRSIGLTDRSMDLTSRSKGFPVGTYLMPTMPMSTKPGSHSQKAQQRGATKNGCIRRGPAGPPQHTPAAAWFLCVPVGRCNRCHINPVEGAWWWCVVQQYPLVRSSL